MTGNSISYLPYSSLSFPFLAGWLIIFVGFNIRSSSIIPYQGLASQSRVCWIIKICILFLKTMYKLCIVMTLTRYNSKLSVDGEGRFSISRLSHAKHLLKSQVNWINDVGAIGRSNCLCKSWITERRNTNPMDASSLCSIQNFANMDFGVSPSYSRNAGRLADCCPPIQMHRLSILPRFDLLRKLYGKNINVLN